MNSFGIFFAQIDAAQSPILVASLAGISISAAAFLYTASANARMSNFRELSSAKMDSVAETRSVQLRIARIADTDEMVKNGISKLINAFYYFATALVYSLSIDPLIDNDLSVDLIPAMQETGFKALDSNSWTSIEWIEYADVSIYSVLFVCGLLRLLFAARTIQYVAVSKK